MSELLGNNTGSSEEEPQSVPDGKVETNVKGIYADSHIDAAGGMKHPVFRVEKSDFYNNMHSDRKRMRFVDNNVSSYMRGSRYKEPFYIEYAEGGKSYRRRVK